MNYSQIIRVASVLGVKCKQDFLGQKLLLYRKDKQVEKKSSQEIAAEEKHNKSVWNSMLKSAKTRLGKKGKRELASTWTKRNKNIPINTDGKFI